MNVQIKPNDLAAFWMPSSSNRQFKKAPRMFVGAEGVHYITNDGRRVLDGTSGLWCVNAGHCRPKIVEAVGDRIEVHIDGGIHSGQDVLKAVALGARGTYIGRAFLWGLGAGGKAGVTRVLEILQREMDITMALCGKRDIKDVNRDILAE